MSSQYTGNPAGGPNLGSSSAPGPGVEPTVSVPADGDPNNSATMFAQQYPTLADYVAYIQRSVRLMNPQTAVGGAFSSVTTNALGGTVTPSGTPSPLYDKWLIKIQTGGAVGTATFKTSIDGGTTFGALQTTAASMTDATTGITLAFSGTFLANGMAAFRNAILPMAMWQDGAGNVRHFIDHNGYPMGRRSEFRENWAGLNTTVTAAGSLAGAPNWAMFTNGSVTGFSTGQDVNNLGSQPASMANLAPGNVSGNYLSIGTGTALGAYTNYLSIVLEWEAAMTAAGANNQQINMGLLHGQNFYSGVPLTGIFFQKASADTNWQAVTDNSGSSTVTNTGIAPVALTMQRFKIEYHGSASPIGNGTATALFFINESLVAVTTTNLPPVGSPNFYQFNVAFGIKNTGNIGGQFLYVSPVLATWNRALTLPAL